VPFAALSRWIVDRGLAGEGLAAARTAGISITYAEPS
jgi:hypothetical protein